MITLEDVLICAKTVWGEARGEDSTGKRAVVHVMLNRLGALSGQFAKDDTLATTCLRHKQFSVWNSNDPNFRLMNTLDVSDPIFRLCLRAVLEAIDESDFTFGSKHYHAADMEFPTAWGEPQKPIYSHGGHVFYNNVR